MAVSPVEIDVYELYKGYPSLILNDKTLVSQKRKVIDKELETLTDLASVSIYKRLVGPHKEISEISALLGAPKTLANILKKTKVPATQVRKIIMF